MGSFSSSTTLARPAGGDNSASITVQELSYNADTNVSTIRITLSQTVNYRWSGGGGGYLWATIYTPWEDSSTSNQIYVQSETLTDTTTQGQGHVWSYSWDKTMHARYDGLAECSADWGWTKIGSNQYTPNSVYVSEGSTLHTIGTHDRASTLTLNNPNATISIDNVSTLNMTVNRKSSLMTKHDIFISYAVASQYGTTIELTNGATSSNTYKVNTGLLNYLPANGKTITGTIVLRSYYLPSYDGGVHYKDSSPITFTAVARDSDIAPTLNLNTIDWTDDNNVTSTLVGNLDNYILNVSKCILTGSASTKYNATISEFGLFTNENKSIGIINTGTTANFQFILNQIAQNSNFTSSNTLKVKITDSRGASDYRTVPLSFIPYIKKSLNETYDVARVNPTSPTVEINSVTGKWWNGNFLGNTNNDLTISWAYKEASSTGDYTTGGTLDTLHYSSSTPSGTYTSYDNTTQTFTISNYAFPQNFNYQKAYSIRLTVTDAVTGQIANPLYITISAGVPNFTIHKDTILINGKTIWDILYPIGSVYMTEDSNFDPNNYFTGTTWSRVSGYYLYAGTTPGFTSYSGPGTQSHTLTSAESGVPAHSHGAATSDTSKSLIGHAWDIMIDDGRSWVGTDGILAFWDGERYRTWNGSGSSKATRCLYIDATHSHNVAVSNNTAADATNGHTHPIAAYTIRVWRRTA